MHSRYRVSALHIIHRTNHSRHLSQIYQTHWPWIHQTLPHYCRIHTRGPKPQIFMGSCLWRRTYCRTTLTSSNPWKKARGSFRRRIPMRLQASPQKSSSFKRDGGRVCWWTLWVGRRRSRSALFHTCSCFRRFWQSNRPHARTHHKRLYPDRPQHFANNFRTTNHTHTPQPSYWAYIQHPQPYKLELYMKCS